MQVPTDVRPLVVQHGFEESRRKLVDVFNELMFARVAIMTFPKNDARPGMHFQGEAVELFAGRSSRAPRVVFFSRYGRQQGIGMSVLGATVCDTPLGAHHPSATPQIGDIIVGSVMPAARGKIPFELRGWCAGGKPLMDLARIVQFGSRMNGAELKRILKQPSSDAADALLRLSSSLTPAEKHHATQAQQCGDELWLIMRIVCYGDLSDPGSTRLSKPFAEFVDSLAIRFGDEAFIEAWSKARPKRIEYNPTEVSALPTSYPYYQTVTSLLTQATQATQATHEWKQVLIDGSLVTKYLPIEAPKPEAPQSEAPCQAPGTPMDAPSSPPYPSSPHQSNSPAYAPSSPPASPYAPSSPPYVPFDDI